MKVENLFPYWEHMPDLEREQLDLEQEEFELPEEQEERMSDLKCRI